MKIEFKECPGKLKSWNDTDLVLEHFISTETQDSGGDIMLAEGMKLRGAPVVLFQHGLDIKFGSEPIAKVLDVRVGEHEGKKGLIAKTKYYDGSHLTPPDATGRRLYEKAKDGTMPNWSIGFNSIKEKPTKGGRIVEEWDLHEYSQVAVGMNAEARTLALGKQEYKFVVIVDKLTPGGFDTIDDFMEKTEETVFEDVASFVCKDNVCTSEISDEVKPYANEHACRINEPSKFTKFRRQNAARDHDGKKYDVIYGQLKGSDKWSEQAYRYPKSVWSVEDATAHCKSKDGSFEAAKAEQVPEIKSDKPVHARAHKAIHAFHAALVADLKDHARKEEFLTEGAEKCSKEALDDFGENVLPHVEKYVKVVREMADGDVFGDEDETAEPIDGETPDAVSEEEKGFRKCADNLKKCTTTMIKAIREHKGKKSVVPSAEAVRHTKEHYEAALPHATEFVKAWYEKIKVDKAKPETKPSSEKPAPSDPAEEEKVAQKVFKVKPPATVKVHAPRPKPPQTLRIKVGEEKPAVKITAELVKELIDSATSAMTETLRAEMKKLAGKVT